MARYHSAAAAKEARADFELRFSKRDLESAELPDYAPAADLPRDVISLVVDAFQQCFKITKSRGDARRLIEGGSVMWRGEKISDVKAVIEVGAEGVLKLDRKNAVRISK